MAGMLQRLSRSLRTASAVALLTVTTFAAAQGMRGDHPDTYVVVRGDTLWGIAGRFLDKPWLWPEIWQANPQIGNPHLIYPGDVVSLAYLNRVTLQPGPRPETIAPINAISLSDIEPFLKDRSIVFDFEQLPYVLGYEDARLRGSVDRNIYVTGLADAQPGQRYAVLRAATEFYGARRSRDLDFRGKRIPGESNLWRQTRPRENGQDAFIGYEMERMGDGTVMVVNQNGVVFSGHHQEVVRPRRSAPATAWCRSIHSPTTCSSSRIRRAPMRSRPMRACLPWRMR